MRRLLLVDDDAAIRAIVRLSLERVGSWTVVEADCGQEALRAVRGSDFDAVLLDVMMSGIDGPTTLKLLRQGPLPAAVPVVFLTAKVQQAESERLRSLGGAGVIAKPFDPMTLATDLDRLLEPPQASPGSDLACFWQRSRPLIEERARRIEAAAAALAAGSCRDSEQEAALTEAHRLAGLLGTVGVKRGSVLAREIERGLRDGGDPRRIYRLAAELRDLVTGVEVASRTTSSGSA